MPCLELKPFPVCGVFGDCDTSGGPNQTFCACEEGWSQSKEFAYFNPDNDILSGSCFYNQKIIDALYSLVLIFSIISMVALSCIVKTQNELRSQIPTIISRVLLITLSIYRLIFPEVALVGEDVFFSLLVGLYLMFFQVAQTIFLNKYILYMLKKTEILDPEKNIRRAIFLNRLNYVHVLFQVVSTQLFWITSLTERETGVILLYTFFSFGLCSNIILVLLIKFALGNIISDLEKFLGMNETGASKYEKRSSAPQHAFTDWARKHLPKLKRMRKFGFLARTYIGSIYLISLSSEGFFQLWAYFTPFIMLNVLATGFIAFIILRNQNYTSTAAKSSVASLSSGHL